MFNVRALVRQPILDVVRFIRRKFTHYFVTGRIRQIGQLYKYSVST